MDNMKNLSEQLIFTETSIFLAVFIVVFSVYYFLRKRNKKSYNLPPGPVGLPFVGYLPFLGRKPHKTFKKLSEKYGNVFSFYLGPCLTVVFNDWPSTEEAFSKVETAARPPGVFDAIPDGLGFGGYSGKDWVELRRFCVKTMRDVGLGRPQWEELLQAEVDELIQTIRDSKGKTINIREVLASSFTNNIITLLIGDRLPQNHPITHYINESSDFIIKQFATVSPPNFLPGLFGLLNKLGLYGPKNMLTKMKGFHEFVRKSVKEAERIGNNDGSFIGLYLKELKTQKNDPYLHMKESTFYGNLQTLLLGGTDTARTTMVWLLKALALNPDVQKRIHEELDTVVGREGKLMWSEREKVPYTYSAISEALRWKTIVPSNTIRMVDADTTIQGYDIPKGTYIIANQWALHTDPKYWPEPKKFKPERFLTDNGNINHSPDSYIPFSYGRRNCPGKLIGLMELFEYLVTMMQNFTVLPPEDGKIEYKATLGLVYQANSMRLRFIPRD